MQLLKRQKTKHITNESASTITLLQFPRIVKNVVSNISFWTLWDAHRQQMVKRCFPAVGNTSYDFLNSSILPQQHPKLTWNSVAATVLLTSVKVTAKLFYFLPLKAWGWVVTCHGDYCWYRIKNNCISSLFCWLNKVCKLFSVWFCPTWTCLSSLVYCLYCYYFIFPW